MASKYERITDLYLQMVGEVAAPEVWPKFLTTACYNFRLSFDKQILLYAQRPDATAVLPIEGRQGWNQRFGRWVNRGSKGIAILDSDSNGQARIKYYFDIADTYEGRYPQPVPIWTVRPEQEQAIMETLENSFGTLESKENLGTALLSAASNVMEDNFQDYLAQLIYYKEGSFLEPLDEESLEAIFKPMLQNSIGYMLLVRCGIDPSKQFTSEDFSYISGFNTLQTINALGTATSDISQMCLSEIARTVLSIQRESRTFAEATENEYAVAENQPERSMNHDTDHIHEAGGLSASQPSPAPGTPDSPWEVRIDAPQIPSAEPESDLHESSDHGAAPQSPDGDRADSPEPGGANRQPDGEGGGGDGGAESNRPDEVGGADEQLPLSSGGADSAGIDLRIEGILPPPSFEEQISFLGGGYLAPEQEGEQQTFFSQPQLPQQVTDEALCIGFNDQNSRLIICAYFMKDKPLEDNAAFLQKSYGTNGAGLFIQDREYAIWYDADGIRIATGRTVQNRYTTLVTWEQAAKRIRELLDLGRYMPQSEIDRVQDFERMELAKSLIYARREFSEEARDAGYLPLTTLTYSAKGGFPEIEKQMQRLLEDRDTLSQLVDEWTLFAAAYEKDRSLLRSRWYDPAALLGRLEDSQREPLVFTAADGYDPQRRFFISDDEIDRILRGSERSYESRLDTFSFFSRNTDTKERERFLKQQHGEYSGYHGGNDSQTYTSAGLSFSHGDLGAPYAQVELKWPAITKRVSDMISMGRFLYPSDAERMADYEVKQLAKLVMNFFQDTPDGFTKPTERSIFDYWDGVADIQGQLTDPERVREIYETMMLPLWNATLPGDRFYQERERSMEAMQAYRAGSFSVFGRDHTLRPLNGASKQVEPQEQEDSFDDIDPEQIRDNLAKRGIVNGEVVDPDALESDPFTQQVVADAAAAHEPDVPIPTQPKPKRERITFEPLLPEIPRERRSNFHITDPELGYGTASEKYAANVAAIRMLKRIEDEGRLATPVEQDILSRYVGWGGLADCFDEKHSKYQELKALLSAEEYAAARASSLTAFYTSPIIIQSMYQALEQMGFREGNILEPSCGVGNFIGMIPESMAGSHAYGVELDSISGRIAQQLYQNSSIAVTGFEKVQMPDSFFDVAIGNVPFGDFKVLDKRYDKHHWLIHDYFFGKTLDKVRPGGIVVFITSKGTMDKENSNLRKYLAQRADLIGAIRLPNTAFKRNAGTEVTSDILFLQKRDRMTDIEPDWVHLDTDPNGIRMNSYFVQNPDMVLGEMVMDSTRFGMDSVCRGDENADLSELLQGAIQNLHAEITEYQQEELEEEDNSIPADPNVRNFSYTIVDGKVYFRENSRMNPVEVSVTAENRIRGMIALRDCVRRLIDYQTEGYPDEDIQREQAQLNSLYDDYTKKYGLLSSRGNSLAFGEDSSYFLLCSLEVLDEEGNFKRKADMFTKRTIRPHVAVTSVDTASEALAVSIAEKARVDMPFMAELSGKTEAELEAELAGVIFRDVNCAERKEEIPVAFVDLDRYAFVTADEYLSGNVRRKLRMVKALCEVLPEEKAALLQVLLTAQLVVGLGLADEFSVELVELVEEGAGVQMVDQLRDEAADRAVQSGVGHVCSHQSAASLQLGDLPVVSQASQQARQLCSSQCTSLKPLGNGGQAPDNRSASSPAVASGRFRISTPGTGAPSCFSPEVMASAATCSMASMNALRGIELRYLSSTLLVIRVMVVILFMVSSLFDLADCSPEMEADDVIAGHAEGLDHGLAFGPDNDAVNISFAADVQARSVFDRADDFVDPADQVGELGLLFLFHGVFEPGLTLCFVADLQQSIGDSVSSRGQLFTDALVVEAALFEEILDGLPGPEVGEIAVTGLSVLVDLPVALQLGESAQGLQTSLALFLTEFFPVGDEIQPALAVVFDGAGFPFFKEVFNHLGCVGLDKSVSTDLGTEFFLPVLRDALSVGEFLGGGFDVVLFPADVEGVGALSDQLGQLVVMFSKDGLPLRDGGLGIYYLSFELFLRHGVSSCRWCVLLEK